jgi:hypothetical protein
MRQQNAVGGKYYCYKKIYVQAHLQIQEGRSCLIIDKKETLVIFLCVQNTTADF